MVLYSHIYLITLTQHFLHARHCSEHLIDATVGILSHNPQVITVIIPALQMRGQIWITSWPRTQGSKWQNSAPSGRVAPDCMPLSTTWGRLSCPIIRTASNVKMYPALNAPCEAHSPEQTWGFRWLEDPDNKVRTECGLRSAFVSRQPWTASWLNMWWKLLSKCDVSESEKGTPLPAWALASTMSGRLTPRTP